MRKKKSVEEDKGLMRDYLQKVITNLQVSRYTLACVYAVAKRVYGSGLGLDLLLRTFDIEVSYLQDRLKEMEE